MRDNSEHPEQLTLSFYEKPVKSVKGTIYLDTSKKGATRYKAAYHNLFRAEVSYNGVKYRKRSADRRVCEEFLLELARKHEKGLL